MTCARCCSLLLTVTFGDHEGPGTGYRFVLEWVREDREGHWYRWGGMEGLCPALLRYFDNAPAYIYCLVTARRTPFSVIAPDRSDELRRHKPPQRWV